MERPRARRLTPEARRRSLIEATVAWIREHGHAGCSLEQVAERAGVSKALVYKYFPRRSALLEAVLAHEFEVLRGRGLEGIPEDVPAERIIRATVERALTYYDEHGPVLRLLAADPEVASLARAGNRSSRSDTTSWFAERLAREHGLPRDVALIAVTLVVNAPIHSMGFLRRNEVPVERTVEVWTAFILGGWEALRQRYGDPRAAGKSRGD